MKRLVIDSENTTFQKGNPFSRRNKCCAIAWLIATDDGIKADVIPWEYGGPVSRDYILVAEELIEDAELLIGFNLKYDLHWLRKCGIIESYSSLNCELWDCQLAQFIISNQQMRYPSLNKTCEYWKLEQKLDVVEKEYWALGIDTPDVPWEILSDYAKKDVDLTYEVYQKQQEYLMDKPELLKLIQLSCNDLIVLAEMEWNGLKYDVKESAIRAEKLQKEIKEIDANIKSIVGNYEFNFNSNDHVSVLLYGGIIKFVTSTVYEHTYKSGPKVGLTEPRFRHTKTEIKFPRLVEPLERSELAKSGYWSTDESVLNQLKATGKAKQMIQHLLRRSELERLESTYYRGFPKKILEMDWEEGMIHSQLNQCVAVTGRLSSSGHNQQNIPPEVNELVQTRF